MVKILHFADLHLGVENYGRTDPATGLSSRLGDFLQRLDEVVEYALAERVDLILFAGDAFKTRDPNPTVQRAFAQRIRRLSQAAIPTILLIGNHDLPGAVSRATSVEIYDALGIDHIYVCRRIERLTIETAHGAIQIVTLPWITRSALLTREEFRAQSADDLEDRLRERVIIALEEEAANLDPALPAVLVGHLSLGGATFGSEQSIMLGRDLLLNRVDLQPHAFDYIALGHIHKHQHVGPGQPPIVYSGSLERVDFGEEHEAKGFIVIEIGQGTRGDRTVTWTFHPVASRPFVTLRITVGDDAPLEDIRRAIVHRADLRDAIVRAFIKLPPEGNARVQLAEVRRLLIEAGAAHVGQVQAEVERQIRIRLSLPGDEDPGPLQVLRQWLALQQVPAARQSLLLRHAEELVHDSGGDGADRASA